MDGVDALQVRLLGPLEIQRAGVPVPLTSAAQRLILARLAVVDGPVPEDQLVDAVWGEHPPASATTSLRAQISRLRTSLRGGAEGAALSHGPGGYRLEGSIELDHLRFEQHVTAARASSSAEEARQELASGLALWRGEALADHRYEPFAQPAIARLEALRLSALEQRIGLDVAAGRADEVVPELEELCRRHPFRERLAELLMTALAREDRVPEALDVYRRVEEVQRRELGLDPSTRLRALQRELLQGTADLFISPAHPLGEPTAAAVTGTWRSAVGAMSLPGVSDEVRLDLLLARGEGLRRAGRTDEARHTYAAATQLATALDRPDQLASAVLGLVGPPEDSLAGVPLDEPLVERALLRLPASHPVVPRLQARLAVGLIDRGEHDRGEALLAAGLAAARAADDPAGVAYALRARHRTWFDPRKLDERLASADELVRMGRDLASADILSWAHRWRFIGLLEAGELGAAEAHLDALDELAETHRDAFHRWFVVVRRAGLALVHEPDSPAAEDAVLRAVALTDRIPSPYTTTAAMLLLWSCHHVQGRTEDALSLAEAMAASQPLALPLVAWSAAVAGGCDRAEVVLREQTAAGADEVLAADRIRVTELSGLVALAETACILGDRERAALLRGRLSPYAARLAVLHPGVTAVGRVEDTLTRLDALSG